MLVKAVYFGTGLGHEAVLAFFALSGFLVGGSALRSMRNGTWSATHYITARLSRLWTVAIPALILTWCLDQAGLLYAGPAGYEGAYWSILSSGPRPAAPVALDALTFAGNVLFLRTIAVPVLGTNGPLWSLANEFWYYAIFPLMFWAALARSGVWRRLAVAIFGVCLAALLPRQIVLLGIVWLAGALARMALDKTSVARAARHWAAAPVALTFVGASLVVGASSWRGPGMDVIQGLAWAIALPPLAVLAAPGGRIGRFYTWLAVGLSEISYTTYATHFPFLALIYFTLLAPNQWAPGGHTAVIAVAMVAAALGLAFVMWWLFERHTQTIRRLVLGRIVPPTSTAAVRGKSQPSRPTA